MGKNGHWQWADENTVEILEDDGWFQEEAEYHPEDVQPPQKRKQGRRRSRRFKVVMVPTLVEVRDEPKKTPEFKGVVIPAADGLKSNWPCKRKACPSWYQMAAEIAEERAINRCMNS